MDYLQVLMIILIIIGFFLIVISIHLIKKESEKSNQLGFKVDEAFTMINNSIEEYEQTTSEFNDVAEIMFKEIDEKYQELLLIYGLVDELKNNDFKPDTNVINKNYETKKVKYDSFIYKNKNSIKIFELYDGGMSVENIAKNLKIGIGEVQLIINLRKA